MVIGFTATILTACKKLSCTLSLMGSNTTGPVALSITYLRVIV
ncbi:hypothetical protein [Mucilaginibacter sp. 21P]